FSTLAKVTHAVSYSVFSAWQIAADQVAKDSFNHRSSHHCMVTKSPNHMCASSCKMVSARRSYMWWVAWEEKTYSSRMVPQPALSIAPALSSGTTIWSYLRRG